MDFIKIIRMVKSEIHRNWYLWGISMSLIILFGLVMYIIRPIIDMFNGQGDISYYYFVSFFFLLELFLVLVVKDFKYIKIDKEKKQLRYYSILSPFGRTLNLENYENKIITSEVSIQGSYDVIHLVNKKGYTAFKISGLFYENFKEINSSIKLQRIYNYRFNWKLYLKLLFTGRIKVQQK